jgi:hypothetical protein
MVIGNSERTRLFGRYNRSRWDDNIEVDIEEENSEDVDLMQCFRRFQWYKFEWQRSFEFQKRKPNY